MCGLQELGAWSTAMLVMGFTIVIEGRSFHERSSLMLHDICSRNPFGARRFFLDQGENGTLVAKNLDINRIDSLSRSYYFLTPLYEGGQSKKRVCSVELSSCPSCSLILDFKVINLSPCDNHYYNYNNNNNKSTSCDGCDYITVKENYYTSPLVLCGSDKPPVKYRSIGRSVTLSFVFNQNYEYAFLLEYASVANIRLITGKTGQRGVIQSPHFPTSYSRDYSNELRLENVDHPKAGSIKLVFDDFQLGSLSFIEILDENNTRVRTLSGSLQFRPPVLIVNGNKMTLRYYVNGGRGLGYQATYTFLNQTADRLEIPITDCGGIVDNVGGVITMANMSGPGAGDLFDCIWLVKPYSEYQPKSHLLVRIEQLTNLESNSTLEVRQGLTSISPLIETLTADSEMSSEYLIPADIGFYIRLRGRLSSEFIMAIAYTAFGYTECYSMRNFMCLNHRCISSQLRCDGFNHCGDNSDEETACSLNPLSPQDPSWWYTHTPKYFFPKSSESREFAAPTFIFLAATIGIGVIAFIVSILTLLYRMTAHSSMSGRDRQARMDFVRSQLVHESSENIENPPSYEAPPDYAEIFKAPEPLKEVTTYDDGTHVLITHTTAATGDHRRRELLRRNHHQHQQHQQRRDTNRSAPNSRNPSPARSRSTTPGQSRSPQRRFKKTAAVHSSGLPQNLISRATPVDAEATTIELVSERSSPPPPYVCDPNSPFQSFNSNFLSLPTPDESSCEPCASSSTDGEVQIAVGEDSRLWTDQDQEQEGLPSIASAATECGCAGACSCQTLSCDLSDSNSLLITPSELKLVDDSQAQDRSIASVSSFSDRRNRAFNSKFSSFRGTTDQPNPRLAMTRNCPWNNSM